MLLTFLYQGCSVCWVHHDPDLGCDVIGSCISGLGKPAQRAFCCESVFLTGIFSDGCLRARYSIVVFRVRGCSKRSTSLCFPYFTSSSVLHEYLIGTPTLLRVSADVDETFVKVYCGGLEVVDIRVYIGIWNACVILFPIVGS